MIEAVVIGFAAGVVAGMLGVGGGVLFVPALTIFLDLGQLDAEATSLLAIVPVSLIGAWSQHAYGHVHLRDGLAIGGLAVAGAAAGVVIANAVPERALEISFGLLLLAIAAQLVRQAFRQPPARAVKADRAPEPL